MNVQIVHGDLLDQEIDVIVNAWNRNIIPGGSCCRRVSPGRSSGMAVSGPSRNSQSIGRFHWAAQC
jgi:hypothetical protein